MARYKRIDTGLKLLPVDLSRQLLPMQVVFFTGKTDRPNFHTERMKRKLDSDGGRRLYGQPFAPWSRCSATSGTTRG